MTRAGIADDREFFPKDGQETYHNDFDSSLEGDSFPTLIDRWPYHKIELLMVVQINEDRTPFTLSVSSPRHMTFWRTDWGQCCLTFHILMGTELTDWPTTVIKTTVGSKIIRALVIIHVFFFTLIGNFYYYHDFYKQYENWRSWFNEYLLHKTALDMTSLTTNFCKCSNTFVVYFIRNFDENKILMRK